MFKNKWTGFLYEVIEDLGSDIKLKCINNSKVIVIKKSELNFNYYRLKEKNNANKTVS